jgi:hypothetical protein
MVRWQQDHYWLLIRNAQSCEHTIWRYWPGTALHQHGKFSNRVNSYQLWTLKNSVSNLRCNPILRLTGMDWVRAGEDRDLKGMRKDYTYALDKWWIYPDSNMQQWLFFRFPYCNPISMLIFWYLCWTFIFLDRDLSRWLLQEQHGYCQKRTWNWTLFLINGCTAFCSRN